MTRTQRSGLLRATGVAAWINALVGRIPWLARLDAHTKEVMWGSAVAFALKVLSKGLNLGFNMLLARSLGAEGAGVFYLALTATTFAAVIGQMGLGNALLRFTATSAAQGQWGRIAGVYRKGIRIAAALSACISLLMLACAEWIAVRLYSKPALVLPLRLMSIAILPMCLITLHAELLRGMKKIRDAEVVSGVGVPLLSTLLLVPLSRLLGVPGAVVAHIGSVVSVLLLGAVLWRRAVPQIRNLAGEFDTRLLMRTSLPLFWIALMNMVMEQASTMLLGVWVDSKAIGIYGVAMRTATLTTFVLLATVSIVASKFAALYAQGERKSLETLARNVVRLDALVATLILIPFVLVPNRVLALFGAEFSTGGAVLTILAVGQFVNVATGPVGYLLIMTGHEKVARNNVIWGAVLNLVLSLALIPGYGIIGAAIATSVSVAFKSLNAVRLVRRHLAIRMWFAGP